MYFFASQLDFTDIKSNEAELARARHLAEDEVARRTADLTETLRVKTALVHEVDHRVKNNLATIASIMKRQARITTDYTVRRTMRAMLNRVEALSTVQRKLLNDDDVGHFDVADFARDLVHDVVDALKRDDIKLTIDLHEVVVPATKASPLALIINELIGDAVRRGIERRRRIDPPRYPPAERTFPDQGDRHGHTGRSRRRRSRLRRLHARCVATTTSREN